MLTDSAQRGKYPLTTQSHRFKTGNTATIEIALEDTNGKSRGHIPLIPLHNYRKITDIFAKAAHIHLKFRDALRILFKLLCLRIGDKDDAICTIEDGETRALIKNLTGDRVEVEACTKTMHCAKVERQEIEKQCTLG